MSLDSLQVAVKQVGRFIDNNPKVLGDHIFRIAKEHDVAPRDLHFAVRNKLIGLK